MQKNYNAGIYCQLSREDERSGKLVSVENQKIMLERYVHTGVDPLARDRELDMLFERLYEDNVSGKIDDARFAKCLSGTSRSRAKTPRKSRRFVWN